MIERRLSTAFDKKENYLSMEWLIENFCSALSIHYLAFHLILSTFSSENMSDEVENVQRLEAVHCCSIEI